MYQVDDVLGRLVDNGNLKSKLFKCYLHAVTSHCLMGRLTGRTGTEEALNCLQTASTRSIFVLRESDIDLLQFFAHLTPSRQLYLQNLRVMQQTKWSNLPQLNQRNFFHTLVEAIFDQARSYFIFQENPAELPKLEKRTDKGLLERAAIRESSYHISGFGARHQTAKCDFTYSTRDCALHSNRVAQTWSIAKLVDEWQTNLPGIYPQFLREIELWDMPVCLSKSENELPLGYDMQWLDLPSKTLPMIWGKLQKMLAESRVERDKYRTMFLLSTMACSERAKMEIINTLLAFAIVPGLGTLQTPNYPLFNLSSGYEPDRETLYNIVDNAAQPFQQCPERNLVQLQSETLQEVETRRRRMHGQAKDTKITAFVDSLITQFPTS